MTDLGNEGTETTDTPYVEDVNPEWPDQEKMDDEGVNIFTGEEAEDEQLEDEHVKGEYIKGQQKEVDFIGEQLECEQFEGEHVEGKENVKDDGGLGEEEELFGEGLEEEDTKELKQEVAPEEVVEEEGYVEEPPPDPSAPYDFSDSKEALREPYELRPDQVAEVEQLWELFQNYTPAYTDLDNYITEKELLYMFKALMIMTVTEEQFYEVIAFCCRPPHPKGHISYEQFLKMVTIRQRDFPIEEEIRSALQVFDPDRTGTADRENLREVLLKQGHKISQKMVDNLIKEVDMSNDGTLGIEDIVGTMCIDLNKEDIQMLVASLNPNQNQRPPEEED